MCNVFIKQSQQSFSLSSLIFLIHLLSKVHILYVEPTVDQNKLTFFSLEQLNFVVIKNVYNTGRYTQ